MDKDIEAGIRGAIQMFQKPIVGETAPLEITPEARAALERQFRDWENPPGKSFRPNTDDDMALKDFLGRVLVAYADGIADKDDVMGILSHVITSAALGNSAEFKSFIRAADEDLFDN